MSIRSWLQRRRERRLYQEQQEERRRRREESTTLAALQSIVIHTESYHSDYCSGGSGSYADSSCGGSYDAGAGSTTD